MMSSSYFKSSYTAWQTLNGKFLKFYTRLIDFKMMYQKLKFLKHATTQNNIDEIFRTYDEQNNM